MLSQPHVSARPLLPPYPIHPLPLRSLSSQSTTSQTLPTMADRQHPAAAVNSLLQKLREHSPNSTQLVGLAILVVSGGILLLLAGVTLTAAVLGLVFFAPLILITSPVWVPIGLLIFVSVSGFGLCVAAVATGAWMYRYFRGLHPVGSDRVDYARTRLVDTAGHVKDVAIEYGGYFQSKVKDAAPSA